MFNGIKIVSWEVRNIAKISPKMAKKQSFLVFFPISQKLHTIRTKAVRVFVKPGRSIGRFSRAVSRRDRFHLVSQKTARNLVKLGF